MGSVMCVRIVIKIAPEKALKKLNKHFSDEKF
jgi:hypothetical protein